MRDGRDPNLPVSCYRAYARGDRRRDNHRDDRAMYTLQAIVAANAGDNRQLVARLNRCSSPQRSPVVYTRLSQRRLPRQAPRAYTTGDRRGDDRSDSRGDDRPVYTPYYVLKTITVCTFITRQTGKLCRDAPYM